METSKHHTNSKTKQRHDHRHIIQTHLTFLIDNKTLEKTLFPYITNNIPHISTQHGFKSNHSTSTVLHNINNTITTGFNQNKPPERTITVALDMIKAFDTVNIYTLTHKLHHSQIHRKLHQRPRSIHHIQKQNINTTPIQNWCCTRRRPITQ